jgi:hypothetical protein
MVIVPGEKVTLGKTSLFDVMKHNGIGRVHDGFAASEQTCEEVGFLAR